MKIGVPTPVHGTIYAALKMIAATAEAHRSPQA
jgi:hypothetical protein